jgi:hypothetical protein
MAPRYIASVLTSIGDLSYGAFRDASLTGLLYESATDNITAHAGGGQTSATQLTTELNKVTTVTTAGDSIKLPVSAPGLTVVVINKTLNSMQVFGTGTDTIDDSPTATGVSQMQGSVVIYACTTAGAWYTEGLATGYTSIGGGAFQTLTTIDGLTASATQTQAAGTPITASTVGFSTVASAGNAATLPPAIRGMEVAVINETATSMNVFPASAGQGGVSGGDKINGGAQNAAIAVAGGASGLIVIFYCMTTGAWWTK